MHADVAFPLGSRKPAQLEGLRADTGLRFATKIYYRAGKVLEDHLVAGQMIVDAGIVALCFFVAFAIRFEAMPTGHYAALMLFWLPVVVICRLLVNWSFGVYRLMWRFFCLCDAVTIGSSLLIVTLGLLMLRALSTAELSSTYWVRLPLEVIALEFLLSLFISTGVRAGRRITHERSLKARLSPGQKVKRVILYGAGRAGVLLIRELDELPEVEIVGFVDDDAKKVGTVLSGVRVLGTGEALGSILRNTPADEVIISIVTARAEALTRILAACKRVPIAAKIVPGMRELLTGQVQISHYRDIRVEDLLGRQVVAMTDFNPEALQAYGGKRILVTGAGGSIGSELTRQLLLFRPGKILILDKDENSIYELEQELRFRNPQVAVEAVIADIKIPERLSAVFAESKPEVVFHAAAHKHVPLMEMHPCEAILNNVMGTENVLKACQLAGTQRFIFISTDKAVNPTNIMGASKRVGENIVQAYMNNGAMKAACVRFGNVMGSRGSVVPLFLKQIEKGGPVTVTHPDVVRYFMTIPEAVQLVLCAGSLASAGEVFVLQMGTPRKIMDLARQTILLCGKEPGRDIQIVITGLRPGEKMHEELVGANETLLPTPLASISVIGAAPFNQREFVEELASLIKAARLNDRQAIYDILAGMKLGYAPVCPPLDRMPVRPADYAAGKPVRARAATA